MISTRNVYPDLGRELTSSEIGKKVVMTQPFQEDGRSIYTFMVNSLENAFTLMCLSATSAVVSRANLYYYVPKEAMSTWLTVDEFQSSLQKARFFTHYIHYGLPC